MTSKAVLLAAGRGERLKPITNNIPKVMVPIHGKPILEHHVERLARYGIRDIYINLHHLPEVIKNYFLDGSRWDVRITYSYEPIILGTAGAVKNLESQLSKDNFLVIYGDNYLGIDYSEFIKYSDQKGGLATIAVFNKEDVHGCGILDIDHNSEIMKFTEKPKPENVYSHWVNAGVFCFRQEIMQYIENNYSDFGFNVFPRIINSGMKMFAYKMKERVWAIDSLALLDELNRDIQKEGKK